MKLKDRSQMVRHRVYKLKDFRKVSKEFLNEKGATLEIYNYWSDVAKYLKQTFAHNFIEGRYQDDNHNGYTVSDLVDRLDAEDILYLDYLLSGQYAVCFVEETCKFVIIKFDN